MNFTHNLSCRPGSDDGVTPKPKGTPGKRGAAAAADGESPTKKGKTTKGKGGKTKDAEVENGDDEEIATKTEVKQEDAESDDSA